MEDVIRISEDDIVIIDDYEDASSFLVNVSEIAKPFANGAKAMLGKIENILYTAPAFFNMIKSSVPNHIFKAILTNEQQAKIAKGTLKLMTKQDGSLMANLINPKTNKIVSTISLESASIVPNLAEAMTSYATQMQMAQIAEEIHTVQIAIEEVRQGQEYDRLATAYSCQQKLLQAMQIKNPELKSMALLKVASDAEDSRNLLMQSQSANLSFIKSQPETLLGKVLANVSDEKVNERMAEIRESLSAINMVSLAEAMAYQELGEPEAAGQSLQYYAKYLSKAFLSTEGLVERLDSIYSSTESYWSKTLPSINEKIRALPCFENKELLEGE